MRHWLFAAGLFLSACGGMPEAEVAMERPHWLVIDPLPQMKVFSDSAATRPQRPNAEIARDFLELTFQMESGRRLERFSRFEGPITVSMTGPVPATAEADLARLLTRLRHEARIDIHETEGPAAVSIEFVERRRMQALVPTAACFVVPRVTSFETYRRVRREAQVDWATLQEREQVAIFIPADTSPQEVRDCLHEELAQAIGPLNDLYRLSDSVFNDDNFHTVLTGFDMLILRATYAPELRSGMTRAEVAAVLPKLLARINPKGAAPRPRRPRIRRRAPGSRPSKRRSAPPAATGAVTRPRCAPSGSPGPKGGRMRGWASASSASAASGSPTRWISPLRPSSRRFGST